MEPAVTLSANPPKHPEPAQAAALARAAAKAWGREVAQVEAALGKVAASFDPEIWALSSERAQAALKACDSAEEAELLAEAYRANGFVARAVNGDSGHATIVALDEGTVTEFARFYQVPGAEGRRRVVEAIGKMLGYPTCCIQAYATQETRGPCSEDERTTFRRAPTKTLHPLLNRLGRVRAIPHHPCTPECPASVTLAEEILAKLREIAPDSDRKLLDVVRRPMLLLGDARIEVEGEWIGAAYELERAEALDDVPFGAAAWADADRLEFGPSRIVLVARDGSANVLQDRAPLMVTPGTGLAPAAVEALLGGPVPEVNPMPDLPWLGFVKGGPADKGFSFTEARFTNDRLELLFSRGGRVLNAWFSVAGPNPAFKKNAHVAFGYVGQKLEPDEMALLEGVWKKGDAASEAVVASIEAYRQAKLALEEVPRHSRPTRWLGEGPPPPPRLKVLGAKDVERFFHVDYEWGELQGGDTSRVGIIYRCNQWCAFCNLSDMDVKLPPEKVKAAIEKARSRGSQEIILTGGEPTLSPHVLEYVAYAKSLGFREITMQTNAVRIARSDLAEKLRAAGLTKAQVSLHGPDGKISDRLTQAPGTHEKTVEGITKLVQLGVRILVNHLIFRQNAHLLVDFVEFCRERWDPRMLTLQFRSVKNEFNTDEDARTHVPRYSDYVRPLLEAMRRARAYGFGTSHILDTVGVPSMCVLQDAGVDVNAMIAANDQPGHHAWESDWFTRLEACRTCGVSGACQGARTDYVQLFGESEFHPLPVLPAMALRKKH